MSANHIEDDIDFALAASADYIILYGRGGGTSATPFIFHDHISVLTIPALARAHLDANTGRELTLVITGGLRVADAVAVSNAAMQAVGCIAARMCSFNNCPVRVATQNLACYFGASVDLIQVLARACGHNSLSSFVHRDITTWKKRMADLSGVRFGGIKH